MYCNWPLEWFVIQISSRCLIHLVFPVAYAKLFLSKCLSKHCWTFTCYTKFFVRNLPCLLFHAFFVVYFLQLSLIGRKSHVKKDYPKIAETERYSYREFRIFSYLFTYTVENGPVLKITQPFIDWKNLSGRYDTQGHHCRGVGSQAR